MGIVSAGSVSSSSRPTPVLLRRHEVILVAARGERSWTTERTLVVPPRLVEAFSKQAEMCHEPRVPNVGG